MSQNPTPRWFALSTLSGSVRLVAWRLSEIPGIEVYLPIEEIREIRRGRLKVFQRPLFGRYLFVRCALDSDIWSRIEGTKGALDLLRAGDQVAAIRDEEIQAIRKMQNAKGVVTSRSASNIFRKGDQVRIVDGPLITFNGVIERTEMRAKERVDWAGRKIIERVPVAVVEISLFNRRTQTVLEEQQLERA